MKYLEVHPQDPQPRLISQAVDVLRRGGIIAYPTDSCYALGVRIGEHDGAERIRAIRKLSPAHHFTLVCSEFAQLGSLVHLSNREFRTVKALTPGPYTFILSATKEVPRRLAHPKKKSVGVRIPDNKVALALVRELGEPLLSSTLLLPDAQWPLTEGWQVNEEIGHLLDAVVDAGDCGVEPTTVIDFTSGSPEIARQGAGHTDLFE